MNLNGCRDNFPTDNIFHRFSLRFFAFPASLRFVFNSISSTKADPMRVADEVEIKHLIEHIFREWFIQS